MDYPLPDYAIETTVGPTTPPVSLVQAKAQCRIGHMMDDLLFTGSGGAKGWIQAACELVEKETNLRLLTQTVVVTLAHFPVCGRPIELPVSPVQSITGISYRDAGGVVTTLTGFGTWLAKRPPLVGAPAGGWPATICDDMAAVTVTAVVGWASVGGIPAQAVQAMLLCLGYWHGFRGDGKDPHAIPGEAGLPAGAARLIRQLRRREYR